MTLDLIGCIALIIYSLLIIVSITTIYIYYISNRFLPNFMIKATMWLLVGICLNVFAVWILRISSLLDLGLHAYKDILLLSVRLVLLLILVNFLKQSTKIIKKEKKNDRI